MGSFPSSLPDAFRVCLMTVTCDRQGTEWAIGNTLVSLLSSVSLQIRDAGSDFSLGASACWGKMKNQNQEHICQSLSESILIQTEVLIMIYRF